MSIYECTHGCLYALLDDSIYARLNMAWHWAQTRKQHDKQHRKWILAAHITISQDGSGQGVRLPLELASTGLGGLVHVAVAILNIAGVPNTRLCIQLKGSWESISQKCENTSTG
jgi:hypothetical protein